MGKIRVNHLPGQTWNHLGMNDIEIEARPFDGTLPGETGDGACGQENEFKSTDSALGEEFIRLLEQSRDLHMVSLTAKQGERKNYRMDFAFPQENRCAQYELRALPGGELTVYQYITGEGTEAGAGQSRIGLRNLIRVERGARVKLVQVFFTRGCGEALNDISAELEEDAELEVDQLFLGGSSTVSGTLTILKGRKAAFASNVAYDLTREERLDLNLIARHLGKKTTARMDVRGVLRRGAKKLLRATIDFVTGCSGASGQENEEVLLMDEAVVNQTIPLILCGEEDVEGTHGASIGRVDESQMFYFLSRGIPRQKVYELLANARIETVLRRIDDEQTTERVREYRRTEA